MKLNDFCARFSVSKDWAYREIKAGRLPIVTFCGEPLRPYRIDIDKANELFSSRATNVILLTKARSLKTEKMKESVNRKPLTKEDLWKD
jgi:hypothetical protein